MNDTVPTISPKPPQPSIHPPPRQPRREHATTSFPRAPSEAAHPFMLATLAVLRGLDPTARMPESARADGRGGFTAARSRGIDRIHQQHVVSRSTTTRSTATRRCVNVAVLPAVLAITERERASGNDSLTASGTAQANIESSLAKRLSEADEYAGSPRRYFDFHFGQRRSSRKRDLDRCRSWRAYIAARST